MSSLIFLQRQSLHVVQVMRSFKHYLNLKCLKDVQLCVMIRMFNAMKNITSPFFFLSFFVVCTVMVSRNIVAARNPNHKFLHFVDSTQRLNPFTPILYEHVHQGDLIRHLTRLSLLFVDNLINTLRSQIMSLEQYYGENYNQYDNTNLLCKWATVGLTSCL